MDGSQDKELNSTKTAVFTMAIGDKVGEMALVHICLAMMTLRLTATRGSS